MIKFSDALKERVLVCDGAMGTMLYARGVFINKSFDAMNLTQGELVESVHQEYVRAGADILETNTFGANRIKLGSFGLADRLHDVNVAGVQIARRAAGGRAYVAGSIGPLGIRIEPWGKTGVDEAREYFREQAQALLDGGVDLFILETFRDLNEIGAAIDAVRSVSDLPIVAQMTTEEDGNTLDGTPPERFAPELERRGRDGDRRQLRGRPGADARDHRADGSGDPAAPVGAAERRQAARRRRPEHLSVLARIHGVVRAPLHPAQRRVVGGCCGTTPEHIRQIKAAVRGAAAAAVPPSAKSTPRPAGADAITAPPVPREQKSRLAGELARGRFVIGVELLPPRGFEAEPAIQRAPRAQALRRRRRQHPRRPARGRAPERAVAGGADRAAGRHRDAAALCLPRSQPARHPVRSAGRARDGAAQPAAGHRRSGTRRRLSRTPPRCSTSIRSA